MRYLPIWAANLAFELFILFVCWASDFTSCTYLERINNVLLQWHTTIAIVSIPPWKFVNFAKMISFYKQESFPLNLGHRYGVLQRLFTVPLIENPNKNYYAISKICLLIAGVGLKYSYFTWAIIIPIVYNRTL